MKPLVGKLVLIVPALLIGRQVQAGNGDHGPFPPGSKVETLKMVELEDLDTSIQIDKPLYRFRVKEEHNLQLRVTHQPEGWSAQLLQGTDEVMPLRRFSENGRIGGIYAYRTHLNADRVPDFILFSYSGGNGLGVGYCDVAFFRSTGKGYDLMTLNTLFPDEEDFILLDGKPYFVHTGFGYVDECLNGKPHNFWLYNLIALDGEKLKVDNAAHPFFPKTVWYSFAPNHAETQKITRDEKARLQKHAQRTMYLEHYPFKSRK